MRMIFPLLFRLVRLELGANRTNCDAKIDLVFSARLPSANKTYADKLAR